MGGKPMLQVWRATSSSPERVPPPIRNAGMTEFLSLMIRRATAPSRAAMCALLANAMMPCWEHDGVSPLGGPPRRTRTQLPRAPGPGLFSPYSFSESNMTSPATLLPCHSAFHSALWAKTFKPCSPIAWYSEPPKGHHQEPSSGTSPCCVRVMACRSSGFAGSGCLGRMLSSRSSSSSIMTTSGRTVSTTSFASFAERGEMCTVATKYNSWSPTFVKPHVYGTAYCAVSAFVRPSSAAAPVSDETPSRRFAQQQRHVRQSIIATRRPTKPQLKGVSSR
mmetsp:Transcript_79090/g.144241  ORF Transcript_79090/g.144241 Transcript_79090/m.144241 type:complete len:278 (+) Transcript_79090:903-1736(+)